VLHELQELPGVPAYVAYRYRMKNIPPDLGTHCKPIHDAFQLRTLCRYRQHRPFQPPGKQRLWSHRKSPFNSRYQPLYHVASYTSLLQGWSTEYFLEVFAAIIHDTENCCPRGANLKFHWTTNLLCALPLLVCHWLKVWGRLLKYSSV
jgi:hypothetical protein